MELELEQERIVGYELAAEKTITQEETLETIVPDACPDILRIADVSGCPVMTGKQAKEDIALVSGSIQMNILYEPEGVGGLCKMEAALPFTCQLPVSGLTDSGKIIASVRLCHAEARILNPRKILLRVSLAVRLCVYCPCERRICCGICAGQTEHLCQKKTEAQDCFVCDVAEKPFNLDAQLRLKAGQGEDVHGLTLRMEPVCKECRLIGNKLVFKGAAELVLLYQDGSQLFSTTRETVPFSQIMEVNGGEDCQGCGLTLEVQSLSWMPDTDDSSLLSVSMSLLAQVTIRQRKTLTLLEDLYSTHCDTECQTDAFSIRQLGDEQVLTQPVRELVECDPAIHTLIDSRISFGAITQVRQERDLQLTAATRLELLYLDQDLHLHRLTKELPVSVRVDCDSEDLCECSCCCPDDVYAAPSAGGAEVRFNAEFQFRIIHPHQVNLISSARLGENRNRDGHESPSVVLRMVSGNETLWDIAKFYGTTEEQIAAANGLEDAPFCAGSMLLIPGCP